MKKNSPEVTADFFKHITFDCHINPVWCSVEFEVEIEMIWTEMQNSSQGTGKCHSDVS